MALGTAGGILAYARSGRPGGPTHQEVVTRGGTQHPGWSTAVLILAIAVAVVVLLALLARLGDDTSDAARRAERVARLTAALSEAMIAIGSIQREVGDGQAMLSHLEAEIRDNRQLAELTSEQAAAVRELVRAETGRGTRATIVIGLVSFIGGVGLSWYLTVVR